MTLESLIKKLYESGISFGISTSPILKNVLEVSIWDASSESWSSNSSFSANYIHIAVMWLTKRAIELYPDSEFAKQNG